MKRFVKNLRRDTSGLAMLEFGFSLPLVLGIGLYGVETANLALVNMRISQIALNLADNASRVGLLSSNNTSQLREIDINDVLGATRTQGNGLQLSTRGRVILSSLEEKSGSQMIHWQRCLGLKNGTGYDSSYGITATNGRSDGTTYDPTAGVNTASSGDNSNLHPGSTALGVPGNAGAGMGDTDAKIVAPPDSGVMFVEINYLYKPVVSASWLPGGSARIHYIASFIVRDRRVFTQIFNPSPTATRMTCNLYTS